MPQTQSRVIVEHSAGGVIFRREAGIIYVCLIATRQGERWQLPKGTIERDESPEQAAWREVQEETGLAGKVIQKVGDIEYWYYWPKDGGRERQRHHKRVSFYLLDYESGETQNHDAEVDDARWFSISEAEGKLSFSSEREILLKAKGIILYAQLPL